MSKKYNKYDYVFVGNPKKDNFIQENGIYPVREYDDGSLYLKSLKLQSLLDQYEIRKMIGKKPNK